jgi:hypothetical protein
MMIYVCMQTKTNLPLVQRDNVGYNYFRQETGIKNGLIYLCSGKETYTFFTLLWKVRLLFIHFIGESNTYD